MLIKCDHCGKEFEKPTNKVNESRKKNWKLYCSLECRTAAKNKKIKCFCAFCNKEIWKDPAEIKNSKSGNVFCSKSCACSYNNSHYRLKENNPNWKGGQYSNNYQKMAYRTYVHECVICGCNDEEMLDVHHIDCDRENNNCDNLIILCANHHAKVHRGNLSITDEIKQQRKTLNIKNMKYKIGDKVTLTNGNIMTIDQIDDISKWYRMKEDPWNCYTDEMIEGLVEEETKSEHEDEVIG